MTRPPGFHLYLVRHGESANNALPLEQRVPDPALTELGQKQARHLAQHYHDFDRIDHVLVSPFRRTLQTAQPLLEVRDTRAAIWTDIFEVGGCFAGYELDALTGHPGMNATQIRAEFPQFDIPDDIDDTGWYKSPHHETWDMARSRAKKQAQKIRKTFEHKNTVVFCFIHADFKQLLLQQFVPEQKEYHGDGIPNSSVTHLHFNDGNGNVVDYRNADHLGPDDISY